MVLAACAGKVGSTDDCRAADSCYRKAVDFEAKERFDSATEYYLAAIYSLDSSKQENFKPLGLYCNKIASLLYKNDINSQSIAMLEKAVRYNSSLTDKSQLSESYRGLWKNRMVLGDGKVDSTILLLRDILPQIADTADLYKAKNSLSYYYFLTGDYDKALSYNTEIYEICDDTVAYYKCRLVRSGIFLGKGLKDSAMVYAKEALRSPYIFTRGAAFLRLFDITGDSSYVAIADQISDTIAKQQKPDKVNAAYYGKIIDRMNAEHSLEIEARKKREVAIVVAIVVVMAAGLLVFRMKVASSKRKAGSDDAGNASVVAMQKRAEDLQKELLRQVFDILEIKNHRFKRSGAFSSAMQHIDGGNKFLTSDAKTAFYDSLHKEYALLYKIMMSHFSFSEEECNLFCLCKLGLTTKECAACRNVSDSAIRVLRKRINDKMRKFITIGELFERIRL